MIVGFVRCAAPIYIEVPLHCFSFRFSLQLAFPFFSRLPAHQRGAELGEERQLRRDQTFLAASSTPRSCRRD
jgi:hypothetical protein